MALHRIHRTIRLRNIDSRGLAGCPARAQGTQKTPHSDLLPTGIPLKSQIVNMAAPANTPGRESPHYYPASQRKTAHD